MYRNVSRCGGGGEGIERECECVCMCMCVCVKRVCESVKERRGSGGRSRE
jgi:hypothetical protein